MLTEKEAGERWCPFARVQGGKEPAANRWRATVFLDNPEQARCIGSRCMGWRWGKLPGPKIRFPEGDAAQHVAQPPRPAEVPASWAWVPWDGKGGGFWWESAADQAARRPGFCGLVGRGD